MRDTQRVFFPKVSEWFPGRDKTLHHRSHEPFFHRCLNIPHRKKKTGLLTDDQSSPTFRFYGLSRYSELMRAYGTVDFVLINYTPPATKQIQLKNSLPL